MKRLTKRTNEGMAYMTIPLNESDIGFQCFTGFVADKLTDYEDLEEQSRLIKLPAAIGDTVYIIEKCENIDSQLDGTLYEPDGHFGTATGYYCPYEGCCPHDSDSCENAKNTHAIFEDVVVGIMIEYENDIFFRFENCRGRDLKNFGKTVFLTQEEAEQALKGAEDE